MEHPRVPTARDIMTRSLVTLKPDMTVLDAAELLLQHSISGAPVVDADGVSRHKAYVHTEPPNFDWRREQIVVRTRELDAAIAALSSPAPPKKSRSMSALL